MAEEQASFEDSAIPVVNKLQDILAQLGSETNTIELPQVAVVGCQSSGKSSVLEALVGRDFLPRGKDICTRRPLLLQLVRTKAKDDGSEEEWGEFLHLPGKKFFDFNEIRKEIQAETEKEVGGRKNISHKKIRLKICSPNVLDITLVDLPGLTRVPVGDQPPDIEARIRKMIMSYIKCQNCLILAVTPANSDLATSDALQMAGTADPEGYRTIGVITKLDIMDRGTNARSILLGQAVPLRLGYIGVVNRSQEDILLNRSIKDAIIVEDNFFRSQPEYSDLGDRCGVPQLAKKLNQILVQHIKTVLPGLKSRISDALVSVVKEHASFGDIAESKILIQHIMTVLPRLKSPICDALVSVMKDHASFGEIDESKILVQHITTVLPSYNSRISDALVSLMKEHDSSESKGTLLLNILSKYSEEFVSMIEGKNEEMSTSELFGGARIHHIFQNIFVKSLEDVEPCKNLTDEEILCAVQNATGPKSLLFMSEVPFEVLVRREIARLLDPSLQCAGYIYNEIMAMSRLCMVNELKRFPVLKKRMDDVIRNLLQDGLEPSETMIGHIIEMEMDYINTSHPDFIGGRKALEMASQQIKSSRTAAAISRQKDAEDLETAPNSKKTLMSWAMLSRNRNEIVAEQGDGPVVDVERTAPAVSNGQSSWGMSSIFGRYYNRGSIRENSTSIPFNEPVESMEQSTSMIHLREPPSILRPSKTLSDQEAIEATKLLLRSYYDIVRKRIEDLVPKAIMHFLVNKTKRDLHNVFIKKLYRDKLFEEMLKESDEVAMKRKHTIETLEILKQALRTLDELPLENETVEKEYSLNTHDTIGLPKIPGLTTSYFYNTISNDY